MRRENMYDANAFYLQNSFSGETSSNGVYLRDFFVAELAKSFGFFCETGRPKVYATSATAMITSPQPEHPTSLRTIPPC